MERLAEECELRCSDEKQLQIFEKCLPLVGTERDDRTKEYGWLLLTRILERCSAQCLRAIQSRSAKKLSDVKKEPTLGGLMFLRELLIRSPQVKTLHATVILDIISALIDIAVNSSDPLYRKLCIELYSLTYGGEQFMSERLLATLSAAVSNKLLSQQERLAVFAIRSIGISSLRKSLCELLFDMYSSALAHAKLGQYVISSQVMSILDESLGDPQLHSAALNFIRSLCSNGRSSVLPFISRIVLMLICKLETASSEVYDTLTHLSYEFGPSSTLFRHLYALFSAMKHPLEVQPCGLSAAGLLSAVIESSGYLVKSEVLLSIERKICEEALRNPSSPIYRDILASLLKCNHELVPPPVQIARTVVSRCSYANNMQSLNSLCNVITRPRIVDLACYEVARREASKMDGHTVKGAVVVEEKAEISNASAEVRFGNLYEGIGERESHLMEEDSMDDASGVAPSSSAVMESANELVLDEDTVNSKVDHENVGREAEAVEGWQPSRESVAQNAKIRRKSRKSKHFAQNDVLKEGEASVEEILNMFCPE